MNALRTATVTTADTKEVIEGLPVLGNWYNGDGYDWMGRVEARGWQVISGWGCDGWDLGSWPYIMIAGTRTRDEAGELWGMASYCEGDVTTTWHRTRDAHWEEISRHAHFHWQSGQSDGPATLPATAEKMPPEWKRPYGEPLG
ncbi:hypothetical protein IV500_17165 [Paeniglutamicibacter antarcticus]|uniref:Uncharacterized protein n=1 Tax=Arthrobacter terrae TaxID=2935737 RepID=A0A931G6J3_9MICC|nr:hypothetical protein [Arthrobacter terrae]MBG0741103.1 hypothetical protein [Arthrobacter terrae]